MNKVDEISTWLLHIYRKILRMHRCLSKCPRTSRPDMYPEIKLGRSYELGGGEGGPLGATARTIITAVDGNQDNFGFKACTIKSWEFFAISPTIAVTLFLEQPYRFAASRVNILWSRGPISVECCVRVKVQWTDITLGWRHCHCFVWTQSLLPSIFPPYEMLMS